MQKWQIEKIKLTIFMIEDKRMFYFPLSIREAIDKVNDTWYLPAIQRPYDWGNRNKKKDFIYKLFDSIIREYPIGTLIIWETSRTIPYRPFIQDFVSEKLMAMINALQKKNNRIFGSYSLNGFAASYYQQRKRIAL
jgi:uncharacterized protein with ParB-like and HNH nuclease domain